jgi:hypothetical protein
MGGGGGGGQAWNPGFGEPASGTRLHDYAPTASSTFYQKEQWTALSERYELTMEWAHQLNRKWAPIEEAKLHYNLAAMGAAMMVPSEFQNVLNPMNIALEGRRLEQRAVDAYVEAQIARVPQEIKDNLLESARLAVLREPRQLPRLRLRPHRRPPRWRSTFPRHRSSRIERSSTGGSRWSMRACSGAISWGSALARGSERTTTRVIDPTVQRVAPR